MPIYLLFFVMLLNMTAYRGSRVIITLSAVDAGMPQFSIGVLAAMFSIFPMLLGFYAGKVTDRLGVRVPMVGGSVGVAAGLMIPYFSSSVPALYLAATFIGASWMFYNVCTQNLVGDLSDEKSRAKNFSNYGLLMAGGNLFGPMLVGFAIDHLGHTFSYMLLALVPLLAAVAAYPAPFLAGRKPKAHAEEHAVYSSNLFRNVPLRRTMITSGIILTGTDLFQFYMPIYGRQVGLSASAIGIVLGTFAIAAFVVRVVMPNLVKRFGADRVLVWSLYIGAGAYLLFPMFGTAILLAAMAFILGLGMGCSQPVSLMLIYERAPPGRTAEALGLRLMINNFTHIAVPVLFGSLGTAFGVVPVFLANAAILGAGGVLSARKSAVPRTQPG